MCSRSRKMKLAVLLAIGALVATQVAADEIALKATAVETDGTVYLADITTLRGSSALELGMVVVAAMQPNQNAMVVTLDDVRDQLANEKVNWATMRLTGYAACKVTRAVASNPQTTLEVESVDSEATVSPKGNENVIKLANPTRELSLDSALTIRENVVRVIESQFDVDRVDLSITANERDEELLSEVVLADRIEVEPLGESVPGRMPLVIRRWRDGRIIKEHRFSLNIERRYIAVVAIRSIMLL